MEAMCRQDALQPFNKSSKLSQAPQQRSVVFPQTPCGRNFSLLDKSGPLESGFNQISVKNQRVLASPTSTSQLHSEFSDWHLWKCGQRRCQECSGAQGPGLWVWVESPSLTFRDHLGLTGAA